MTRFPRTLLLAMVFGATPAHAAGLPDTGQDTCYNDSRADDVPASDAASSARDAASAPRQDCRYGRDAAAAAGALTKIGGGAKGFDYTKIANNGAALPEDSSLGSAATDWGCTKDNITGLTWEVKTADAADLRYADHSYTWFNPDGETNGGNSGSTGRNTCNATLPGGLCNTAALAAAVNAAALCSYTDWRLPTRRELRTLLYVDGPSPTIDPLYFPNTRPAVYWSDSPYVPGPSAAWYVVFNFGDALAGDKAVNAFVRLVRGGPF